MRRENADVVGKKLVRNDPGQLSLTDAAKQTAWLQHYQRLLDVEFDWDPRYLSDVPPVEGPCIPITLAMVVKVLSKMKSGKAAGPSGIVVEMIKAVGEHSWIMIRDLANTIIRDGKVPSDCEESFIVCLCQRSEVDRAGYEDH